MNKYTSSQQLLSAVSNYVALGSDEAGRICEEAQSGNRVAQYIVGVALLRENCATAAEGWLHLSANQGYEPAQKLFSAQSITPVIDTVGANG